MKLDPGLDNVGVLMEPTTIVAKAWDHIDRIGSRAYFAPERALVTGAGTIGLLAALLGVQRGLEVHVLDRVEEGIKPELVHALGATYHATDAETIEKVAPPDIVVEATGVPQLVFDVMQHNAPRGRGVPDGRLPHRPRPTASTRASSAAISCSRTT